MRNRCVGLMLAAAALALAPAAGAEEGPDEAVPEHLTDEYVREKVYQDDYKVPEGFETEPDVTQPARRRIVRIRYENLVYEEGQQFYATADTLADARELVRIPEICEESETERYYQFRWVHRLVWPQPGDDRPGRRRPAGRPAESLIIEYHRVLKSSYLERLKADDSGGVLAETPVTPEALRRFAEWFWYTRFQHPHHFGAKALVSQPGESRDGKLMHVLYTTTLKLSEARGEPDRISLKRTVYTCDPETGEFGIESEVVRQIEGRNRFAPADAPPRPRPPLPGGDHRIWPGPPTE